MAFWAKNKRCLNGGWLNTDPAASCCQTDEALNPSSHGQELESEQAAEARTREQYHWVGAGSLRPLDPAPAVLAYTQKFGKTPMVCGIGDSHTERVVLQWVTYVDRMTYKQVSMRPEFAAQSPLNATVFHQTYPQEGFSETYDNEKNDIPLVDKIRDNNCTHVFIQMGQWIAGHTRGPPFSVSRYREEMQKFVDAMLPLDPTKVTVAFRTVNEIPLSELVGACPPMDWRSPAVIAAYNAQLRSIVPPHFPFLDTSAIMEPTQYA